MGDYDMGSLLDDPEDYYPPSPKPTKQEFTMQSGKVVTLHLVGHSPTEAHHLWNGAKFISDYFEQDPSRVRGKTVLELGAAAGLPSLVAGILGAKKVVMTDFPDPDLVANMQKNIDECDGTVEPAGHIETCCSGTRSTERWSRRSGRRCGRRPRARPTSSSRRTGRGSRAWTWPSSTWRAQRASKWSR
ncbi:hypothetical protein HIM_07422 [Hirsutella minnesotensis 3608]|uniref:Protein N-terminal and lysine N-methyltransferase EFM7 n=1 Tax=Hirsutella minnesotensis 3608 TaxID=1043627 RepID=A0A0F7ZN68_9HYPO|nr:hypothetical protein HIM_07422 [Hirsutella minnesotensis 3608]